MQAQTHDRSHQFDVAAHRRRDRQYALHVLQLDVAGTPQAFLTPNEAAVSIATGDVAWTVGSEPLCVLRGGHNSQTGQQSLLEIPAILALKGQSRVNPHDIVPVLTNPKLFRRDRFTCCLCAQVFKEADLTREHIVPTSRGGEDSWRNTASACRSCNSRKGSRLLSEIGMELVYLPYVPSLHEDFLLRGRHIRADVHEWLASRLPKGSRVS